MLDNKTIQTLKELAKEASENAYCPYSNFKVGASVLTSEGLMFSGCNIENISFGLTICAERNAIFQAIRFGHHNIKAIVIYTPTDKPTQPCGACRQVINEFSKDVDIYCFCASEEVGHNTIENLLPSSFEKF